MRNFKIAFFMMMAGVIWSCEPNRNYRKTDDGVVINISQPGEGNAKTIQLNVFSDNIIQVIASPADTFSTVASLMIAEKAIEKTRWDIEEKDDHISIKTSSLKATVNSVTGEICFFDEEGKVLLQEQANGGKTFHTIDIDGTTAYQIRQVFESPDDEAFYGLGGHQNSQMNYKGEDVELVQHNIVDVVPFLYSNKNYGILWDNYSISKFGDPRDYQPINSLTLFDKDGKEGGLTAQYYVNDEVISTAVENKIDYEYLETPQVDSFPKSVAEKGKVVWEGSFTSNVSGDHKFLIYASGYFKVWIDDRLIMDKWRQGWNPWSNKFKVPVRASEKHKIKIEWRPDGGAYIALKHLDPLPEKEQNMLTLSSEVADEINYYFIHGKNADEVIKGYRKLTGKAPIVPKWALGFWQSRERYKSQQELLDVVKEYREREIPLDNIVLDWQYWEDPKWGSHEFDLSRFPDPKGMIDELHKLNAHIMISVWPKFNKGTNHYDEMNKSGFLFTRNIEKQRKDWVGVGYESTFYNPFNPEAGKLFWKQLDEHLNAIGIDAWWLDATEPDMHSNLSIEERKKNMSPTGIGPGAKYFNAYSLVNSKSVYEGQRTSSPDKRVFILTRSAYAGQQRYGAVTWSGDIVSRWSDMEDQISAGVNFSLSGIPYWTMDIGGFAVEKRYENATGETLNEWRELNTRWFQFGAFCPIFRSHGQYPYREIYNIAPKEHDAYKSMVYYTKLRYRLMPYIYSLAGSAYLDDYTIMRGLVMDFNHDANVYEIHDQYMFGPSLLINPVYEYKARERDVYLPDHSGWYDMYTGKFYKGGQTVSVDAPMDRMPVYLKAGAIVPVGPDMQHTAEKPSDPMALYIYGGADGSFNIYEDEGVNYAYENGKYSVIPVTYNAAEKKLTIGKRRGSFDGMLQQRRFHIYWVSEQHPVGLAEASKPQQIVHYQGDEITIQLL